MGLIEWRWKGLEGLSKDEKDVTDWGQMGRMVPIDLRYELNNTKCSKETLTSILPLHYVFPDCKAGWTSSSSVFVILQSLQLFSFSYLCQTFSSSKNNLKGLHCHFIKWPKKSFNCNQGLQSKKQMFVNKLVFVRLTVRKVILNL